MTAIMSSEISHHSTPNKAVKRIYNIEKDFNLLLCCVQVGSARGVKFPYIDAWLATEWLSPLSLFINWARRGFKWVLGT